MAWRKQTSVLRWTVTVLHSLECLRKGMVSSSVHTCAWERSLSSCSYTLPFLTRLKQTAINTLYELRDRPSFAISLSFHKTGLSFRLFSITEKKGHSFSHSFFPVNTQLPNFLPISPYLWVAYMKDNDDNNNNNNITTYVSITYFST